MGEESSRRTSLMDTFPGYEDLEDNPQQVAPTFEGYEDIDQMPANGKIPPTEGLLGSIAKLAQQTGQEVYGQANQFAQGFTSEATLHAPEVLAKFGGPSMNMMTEPKSTAQRIARGAGRIGGFGFGL